VPPRRSYSREIPTGFEATVYRGITIIFFIGPPSKSEEKKKIVTEPYLGRGGSRDRSRRKGKARYERVTIYREL